MARIVIKAKIEKIFPKICGFEIKFLPKPITFFPHLDRKVVFNKKISLGHRP